MSRRLLSALFAGLLLTLAPLTAACSSDTKDEADEALDSAGDDLEQGAEDLQEEAEDLKDEAATKADEGQARVAAEELRSRMKANDTANEEGVRSIAALEESAEDLAGDPEITGIEDGDGDGLDDDGKVQVTVDESQACLTLPEEGEDTTVEGGAC